MEDKVNFTLVGAFVLVLGMALVAGVLWLAAGITGQKPLQPYAAIMTESVAGLNLNAPVKYLGVDVGKVSGIGIDPNNPRQVLLRFRIEEGTPVKVDSEVVLKAQGLTGIAYAEISGGSVDAAPLLPTALAPVPFIRSKASLSVRLENVLSGLLTGLDRLSTSVSGVLDDGNRTALKQMLTDTAALAHTLAAQQGHIQSGMADAARTAHLAAQASVRLEATLQRISSSAAAVERMAEAAGRTSVSAGAAVDDAAAGVAQLRTQTLPELGRLVGEMNALATSLRHLSEQTERHPSSLLVGGPTRAPGPGEKALP